jgi:hypothetical protein
MMKQKNSVSCLNKYSIKKPTWASSYIRNPTLDTVLATETLVYVNRLMQVSDQEDCTEIRHQESVKMCTQCVPNINTNWCDKFKRVKVRLIRPLDKRLGLPQGRYRYGYEKKELLAPCANEVRCRNSSKSYTLQDILFCSLTHHELLDPFSGVFAQVMTSAC